MDTLIHLLNVIALHTNPEVALAIMESVVAWVNGLADAARLALMDSPLWSVILTVLNAFGVVAGVVDIVFEDGSIILELQ